MNIKDHASRYLELTDQIAKLKSEQAMHHMQLVNAVQEASYGELDEPLEIGNYVLSITRSKRTVLRSIKDLKQRFTPTQLKGLLGIVQVNRLNVKEIK